MLKKKEVKVPMSYFTETRRHINIKQIVFRKLQKEGVFVIGFLPKSEFSYIIDGNPDVYFNDLEIKGVYYEPYRTFIRLKKPSTVEISYPGTGDKLYVKGTGVNIPVLVPKKNCIRRLKP